ncbi:DNA cytosine methyltransferase [Desulfoferula mesophila]|uniref:DNA cytosine methyltransferase n=1 Tax=Desulfoferula mesophila TaxID=3058419 RepID=UPI0030CE58D3
MNIPKPSFTDLSAYDLFAGAGGFSLGLEAAGFDLLGAVECDPVAARTLETNFGIRPLDFTGPEEGDIRSITNDKILKRIDDEEVGEIDLLIASPPCQGFSKIGRGKLDFLASKRGAFINDDRNNLYKQAIRLLKILQPRVFLFENVTGILHLRGRNVAEDVCNAVSEAGYIPKCTILNSAWYGVPQVRERVIIMGVRQDLNLLPVFPNKQFHSVHNTGTYSGTKPDLKIWRNLDFYVDPRTIGSDFPVRTAVSVRDAFDDLPEFKEHLHALKNNLKYRSFRACFHPVDYVRAPRNWFCKMMRDWNNRHKSDQVTDHFCRWNPRDFRIFAEMKPDDKYPQALEVANRLYEEACVVWPKEGLPSPVRINYIPPYSPDSFEEKWRKLIPDQPSWTLTAHLSKDTYSHIHFDSNQARTITIREAARIQSFPDSYQLEGNTGDAFRQIGNAVPPLMAKAIGECVMSILSKADTRTKSISMQRAV